ncbi:hypothetical protein PTTG_00570 [Puccinia triticina 1-1 BBBD Race 1]|uniref:Conidiation protein 6 n=2 Tax=Puccinia triticina TaxID=208348 RepID=A0A0C4EIK3_PUCT1|nr:uncharacterized protein PtA15_2A426 [Puccinia triticina]OAV99617.1 hypothetical protein PTTG_00570 [Puccinia triticina 1-1 BBBD Race 1]WAQ82113.1 hypothetical protein PtA15_2A426 [Puccinia triticina]WAR52976.1 hypothetical protein PtB15_2B404 [Puccinia triticina]
MANPGNVAGGLKATLTNPHVSDDAKEGAQHRLDTEGLKAAAAPTQETVHVKDPENVKRGIKAALHNPRVSEGKKEELRHKLDEQF